jgi:hypothetical protein
MGVASAANKAGKIPGSKKVIFIIAALLSFPFALAVSAATASFIGGFAIVPLVLLWNFLLKECFRRVGLYKTSAFNAVTIVVCMILFALEFYFAPAVIDKAGMVYIPLALGVALFIVFLLQLLTEPLLNNAIERQVHSAGPTAMLRRATMGEVSIANIDEQPTTKEEEKVE